MNLSFFFQRYRQLLIGLSFILLLLIKVLLFQWWIYHSFAISSIVNNPIWFWSFWLPKIAIILFLGTFVWIGKRNYWTILFSLLIDFWMLGNMMYFRSNGLLLDGYALTMYGNMDGFWNSCYSLIEWKDTIPFLFTLLYSVFIVSINKYFLKITAQKRPFIILLLISIIINWASFVTVRQYACRTLSLGISSVESIWESVFCNPFSSKSRNEMRPVNKDYAYANYSLIHAIIFDVLDYIDILHDINNPYMLTDDECEKISKLIGSESSVNHNNLLIILLIESLESWAIQPEIMPNLCNFMDTHPVAHVKYSESQVLAGSSSDGQLIINTGLLPIHEGATCYRFPYVNYPSIVDRNDSSVTILTHHSNVWNQKVMNEVYGYDKLLEGTWHDSIMAERIIEYVKRGYKTIQAITVTSHLPFAYADSSSLCTPKGMPDMMAKYCKSLNLTDNGLAIFFNMVDSIPALKEATIVITGDHSIFWKERREEFIDYCANSNLNWDIKYDACPVIYYSPNIKNDIIVDELCYQVDIFPTLLYLTDNYNYHWKGFGINVLDSTSKRMDNKISFELSDKIIRADFFNKLECK